MRAAALLLLASLTVCAQPARNAPDIVKRTRAKLLETLSQLPRYTCIQSLNRTVYDRSVFWTSCDSASADLPPSELGRTSTDRLNLDVAVTSAGREIYSWAGAAQFQTEEMAHIVGVGAIGTGSFGPFLINIFANPDVSFVYRGEESLDGRVLIRFAYQVPRKASRYDFQSAGAKRMVGYDGMLWIDPDAVELIRLQVHSLDIPKESGICESTTTIDFHRVPIGGGNYLLPRASLLEFSGLAAHYVNASAFSGCREYRGESVITFGERLIPSAGTASRSSRLPKGLSLTLISETSFDAETSAPGDPIVARVRNPVVEKNSKRVLIPAGATAKGRVLRVEQKLAWPYQLQVTVEWQTVEFDSVVTPWAGNLDPKKNPFTVSFVDLRVRMPQRVASNQRLSAGRTLVFDTSRTRGIVPAGFESHWLTVD